MSISGKTGAPQRLHKLVSKVAMPKHKIMFQRTKVVEQLELVNEYFKQALARRLVRSVNRTLEA